MSAVNANAMVSLPSQQQMQQSKVQSKPHHPSGPAGRNIQILKNYRNNSQNVNDPKNPLPNGSVEKAGLNQNRLVTETADASNANDNTNQELLCKESRDVSVSDTNIIVDKSESGESQNVKVKTPMCLVNELARHNHVSIF